jgi:hypothetical protein
MKLPQISQILALSLAEVFTDKRDGNIKKFKIARQNIELRIQNIS